MVVKITEKQRIKNLEKRLSIVESTLETNFEVMTKVTKLMSKMVDEWNN